MDRDRPTAWGDTMGPLRTTAHSAIAAFALLSAVCALAISLPGQALCTPSPSAAAATATLTFTTKSPVVFDYGKGSALQGALANDSALLGRTVTLQSSPDAGTSWIDTATALTDGTGRFRFTVAPSKKTKYRARLADNPSVATAAILVAPRLAFARISGNARIRKTRRWFGQCDVTALGNPTRGSVVLVGYRLERGKWRHRATWKRGVMLVGISSDASRIGRVNYWLDVKFPKKGRWRVHMSAKSTADRAASASANKRVRVY
jgi:hypothetical protein